jgi:hypothetical protein
MLLDRTRAATRPSESERLQDRIPSLARLRGRARRLERHVPPRAPRVLWSGEGVCESEARQPPRAHAPLLSPPPARPARAGHPVLSGASVALGEASRLREVRFLRRDDG